MICDLHLHLEADRRLPSNPARPVGPAPGEDRRASSFAETLRHCLAELSRLGVAAADIRFNPIAWMRRRRVPLEQQRADLASLRTRTEFPALRWRVLATIKREASEDDWAAAAEFAIACRNSGSCGIDISRSYHVLSGTPAASTLPSNATRVCSDVRAAGLNVAVHCGRFDTEADAWEAIEQLGANRIGHGVPLFAATDLQRRVRKDAIVVEVCPTAALRALGITPDRHPLHQWLEVGIRVVLGSDHPLELQTNAVVEHELVRSSNVHAAAQIAAIASELTGEAH